MRANTCFRLHPTRFVRKLLFVSLFHFTVLGFCQPVQSDDDFRYSIFDGQSLAGWNIEGDCQVDVIDGEIVAKSGKGWLRSSHEYQTFSLSLEWMAEKESDFNSGVFFGASNTGNPFPQKALEVDVMPGAVGHIAGQQGNKSAVTVRAGEWNRIEIDVTDQGAIVKVNGSVTHQVDDLAISKGAVGIQVTVPNGGTFRFRNISIVEKGFRSLFNGQDFTHWEGAGQPAEKCWKVENGNLIGVPTKGPWLRSMEQFADFNIRLEYQVEPGANSGVFIRVPKDGNHHRKTTLEDEAGIEVQILDDSARKYANRLKDYQYCGSFYDIAGATQRVSRPPGMWNTLEIICDGNSLTSIHNGIRIVETDATQSPLLLLRKQSGFLGLQNHGGGVTFRNIRIRELGKQ